MFLLEFMHFSEYVRKIKTVNAVNISEIYDVRRTFYISVGILRYGFMFTQANYRSTNKALFIWRKVVSANRDSPPTRDNFTERLYGVK